MDPSDLTQLGILVDDSAMNWYVLTHPGTTLPQPVANASVQIPGLKGSVNTNLLILAVVAIAIAIILK